MFWLSTHPCARVPCCSPPTCHLFWPTELAPFSQAFWCRSSLICLPEEHPWNSLCRRFILWLPKPGSALALLSLSCQARGWFEGIFLPVVATKTSQPPPSKGKAVPKEAVVCPVPSSGALLHDTVSPCASTWAAVTSWTQRLIPQRCRYSSHTEELWKGWDSCWDSCLCISPLQGCCPPALCCSTVYSYL